MPRLIATSAPDRQALALEELPGASGVRQLARGVVLVSAEVPDGWRPVFVRHVFPVESDDPTTLAVAFEAGERFSVQTRVLDEDGPRPREINEPLAAQIAERTGAVLDVKHPWRVLSIVVSGGVTYAGVSTVEGNLSAWAGGARMFRREPGQVSRSAFKLMEAVETFGIELPSGGRALDLGAAPGGWSQVLARAGMRVTAVDPAELAVDDPRVDHVRSRADRYLARARGRFDVVCNDMRMDAVPSADLTVRSAVLLPPRAPAVMTIKLPSVRIRRAIDAALDVLRDAYEVRWTRHLFHDRNEVTAHLVRT